MSWQEWCALGWDLQRTYLEGMEQDESVPLTFERRGEEAPEVIPGMQVRGDAPAEVIDITGMLAGLEASRGSGGR